MGIEYIFMLESEQLEKLKREFFGYKDDDYIIPNPDKFIDLSKNPVVAINSKIPDGLVLIKQKTQDGQTLHYSHMPSLLRKMFANPNILPLFDIAEIMEFMTEEEIDEFENSLSDLDD